MMTDEVKEILNLDDDSIDVLFKKYESENQDSITITLNVGCELNHMVKRQFLAIEKMQELGLTNVVDLKDYGIDLSNGYFHYNLSQESSL